MSACEAREGERGDFTTDIIAHGGREVDEHGTGNVACRHPSPRKCVEGASTAADGIIRGHRP